MATGLIEQCWWIDCFERDLEGFGLDSYLIKRGAEDQFLVELCSSFILQLSYLVIYSLRQPSLPVFSALSTNSMNSSIPTAAAPGSSSDDVKCLRTTLLISIGDKVGALDECLDALKKSQVSMTRIESRSSLTVECGYDFFVDFTAANKEQINQIVDELNGVSIVKDVRILNAACNAQWFPRKMVDLDTFADKVLEMGEELSSDHPGAKDPVYRKRRYEIVQNAKLYRTGQVLPYIEYTQEEKDTWKAVFRELTSLHATHACREYRHIFPLLEKNCGYREDNIPQLQDVSNFLRVSSGFRLRPVMGLLSPRDFLNGLAFRVFHCTQYVRHHSNPTYTPEPDVCHELLGHVPLFADPGFAEFSQQIGLASLGASEEDIERLSTIYWFTAEFGLCREDGEIRAYGSGLLSSTGELKYSLSDKPQLLPFDPEKMAKQKYPITEYQPVYFVADTFTDATEKFCEYAAKMERPFQVRYDPYTETIQVLDNKTQLYHFANSIKNDMKVLTSALEKF
ncbi:hypothetical protein H4219_000261 [Mycoemilia scoparia]|uniref:phenylalanine 4-monooxygenase n=1 Tax=Mycoemilia scoparia TaxID=417184 RepID=A0A9W8A664_9FUNG|nr:hypothetical protein H4219_000261 [Mycoemilia scoparia]